ncbi:MAG: DUF3301 domain-containing protein [Gammaproteobacteria bacterium]
MGTFSALNVLVLGLLAGWLWYSGLKARELGTRVAAETCRRQGLQLLDGTVALRRLRPARSPGGWLTLQRTYQFEYSEDHNNRLRGFIIITAARVEVVGLAPPTAPEFSPERSDTPRLDS